MSHLFLAETHHHILYKNVESKHAWEIHSIIASETHEVNLSEAPKRSPREFQCPHPLRHSRFKPKDHKPRNVNPKHKTHKRSALSCRKYGCKGHLARDCRASAYTIELYREYQKCRNPIMEAHEIFVMTLSDTNVENYVVLKKVDSQSMEVVVLDNASTHTILRSQKFFEFPAGSMT